MSESKQVGTPRRDGSGGGMRNNQGRGGCATTRGVGQGRNSGRGQGSGQGSGRGLGRNSNKV